MNGTCEVCGWHGPVQHCEACGLHYCRGCAEEPEYGTGFNCPERDCPCHPIPEPSTGWSVQPVGPWQNAGDAYAGDMHAVSVRRA